MAAPGWKQKKSGGYVRIEPGEKVTVRILPPEDKPKAKRERVRLIRRDK